MVSLLKTAVLNTFIIFIAQVGTYWTTVHKLGRNHLP